MQERGLPRAFWFVVGKGGVPLAFDRRLARVPPSPRFLSSARARFFSSDYFFLRVRLLALRFGV